MKHKIISLIVLSVLVIGLFSSCSSAKETNDIPKIVVTESDLNVKIHSICKLATIAVDYHNVGTVVVPAGEGVGHWGEKDRKYWAEYNGSAKLGIDASKISAKIDGENITIALPSVEILGEVSWDSQNVREYVSLDSVNSNPLSSSVKDETINNAQAEMRYAILSNNELCVRAEDNAKKIIESYVDKMSELNGIEYHIIWEESKASEKD